MKHIQKVMKNVQYDKGELVDINGRISRMKLAWECTHLGPKPNSKAKSKAKTYSMKNVQKRMKNIQKRMKNIQKRLKN